MYELILTFRKLKKHLKHPKFSPAGLTEDFFANPFPAFQFSKPWENGFRFQNPGISQGFLGENPGKKKLWYKGSMRRISADVEVAHTLFTKSMENMFCLP